MLKPSSRRSYGSEYHTRFQNYVLFLKIVHRCLVLPEFPFLKKHVMLPSYAVEVIKDDQTYKTLHQHDFFKRAGLARRAGRSGLDHARQRAV